MHNTNRPTNIADQLAILKKALAAKSDGKISEMLGLNRTNTHLWRLSGAIPDATYRRAALICLARIGILKEALNEDAISYLNNIDVSVDAIVSIGENLISLAAKDDSIKKILDDVPVSAAELANLYGVKQATINMNIARKYPVAQEYILAKAGLVAYMVFQGQGECRQLWRETMDARKNE